jgi:hypothetical protein
MYKIFMLSEMISEVEQARWPNCRAEEEEKSIKY